MIITHGAHSKTIRPYRFITSSDIEAGVLSPNTIGQRIRIARYFLSAQGGARVSQAKLAELCGWEAGQTRIANYERNLREPSAADVSKIARVTGCRAAWIMFGTLPAHDDQEAAMLGLPSVREELGDYDLEDLRVARAIRSLPPKSRVALQTVFDSLVKSAPWDEVTERRGGKEGKGGER
jgi:transcriptional regulator with XRE-family HTH domain